MRISAILQAININAKGRCFLVGGSVRDLLLKHEPRDLDLVVYGKARELVYKLAEKTGIRPVILHKEHDIARAVLPSGKYHLDITGLGSTDLITDLIRRDFTINAMAVPVQSYLQGDWCSRVIDPLGGLPDMRQGIIRACSPTVFNDDPVRVLRAVRLKARLSFDITPGTMQLMQNVKSSLSTAPGERVWEELRLILELPSTSDVISILSQQLHLLEQIFPEIEPMRQTEQNFYHAGNVWDHCLKTLLEFERLPGDEYLRGGAGDYCGKDPLAIIKLACLFHDVGKIKTRGTREDGRITFYGHHRAGGPMAEEMGRRLKMSRRENKLFRHLVEWHMQPLFLYNNKPLSLKAVFRFFGNLGDDTPACLLLSLADITSSRKATGKTALVEDYREYICHLLRLYIKKKDQVLNHVPLLSGREICSIFDLQPGPLVGRLKSVLWEAQLEGRITTRQEALEYLKGKMYY